MTTLDWVIKESLSVVTFKLKSELQEGAIYTKIERKHSRQKEVEVQVSGENKVRMSLAASSGTKIKIMV